MTPRILVVTDNGDLEALLRQCVTGAGIEILLAPSGPEGFRRWKVDAPSLIIVDADLAGLDRVGLTEQVRRTETPGTRIPIITIGGADPRVKLRALQAGSD